MNFRGFVLQTFQNILNGDHLHIIALIAASFSAYCRSWNEGLVRIPLAHFCEDA